MECGQVHLRNSAGYRLLFLYHYFQNRICWPCIELTYSVNFYYHYYFFILQEEEVEEKPEEKFNAKDEVCVHTSFSNLNGN